ncbi:MAG: TolC family protein [Marinifilaceae bacterium]
MKRLLYTIILLFLSGLAFGQEGLSLEQAVRIALENNLNIKVAHNEAEISANRATAGNAGLLPKVTASAGTNYSEHSTDELSSNAALNLSYTLFDGWGSIYNYKILGLQKEQGELQSRFKIENVITQVVTGFYQLSETYDKLRVAEESLDISRERLERNQSRFDFGNINKLEVLNAQVDFNRDSSNYLQSSLAFEEAGRQLNVLMGRSAETKFQLLPESIHFGEFELVSLKEQALNENADYLLAASRLKQDELELKMAKSGQLPKVSLNSSYGWNELGYAGTSSNTQLSGGLSISFNLFDGKKKQTEIVNAKIQKENTELEYQNKLLELERDVVNAYAEYQNNLRILQLEEDALSAAQLNFEQTREHYNIGSVTSTTFREAQLNLAEAQNRMASARYTAKQSEVNLQQLSGSLLKPKE